MKKHRILYLFLFFCIVISGCNASQKEQDNAYQIYDKNLRQTGLVSRTYIPKNTEDTESLIEELWQQICNPPQDKECESVAGDISLLKSVPDGTNLNLYFDAELQNLSTVSQLLFRASLVRTFTSIEGIETVTFFVDETPLTDANYNTLGAQSAADYLDIVGNGFSSVKKASLALYYADETGDKLLRSTKDIVYESSYSLERDVINRLIQGPSEDGYYATLPPDVQVISVNVKNGVCYVNFDSTFVTEALPIRGETIVYSIVNSLCELPDIRSVQIMVNGDSNVTFKEYISLANPLERDLNK